MSTAAALVAATEAFVQAAMAGNDASHDYFHIQRVVKVRARAPSAPGRP